MRMKVPLIAMMGAWGRAMMLTVPIAGWTALRASELDDCRAGQPNSITLLSPRGQNHVMVQKLARYLLNQKS